MEFDNSFEVPLPPAQAWKVLMDIRRIAPCMPGAELTDVVDAQTFRGKISVRLGPVALSFAGLIKLEDVDNANYSARVKAQGSDDKGRGAANAAATFRLEPVGTGSKVLVHTDLSLSGAVAQYGRGVGMIQATASQIIGQFAKNLRAHLSEKPAAPAPPAAVAPASAAVPPAASAPMAKSAAAHPPFVARAPTVAAERSPIYPPMPPAHPPPAAKPISGLSLIARVIWARIVAKFKGGSQS